MAVAAVVAFSISPLASSPGKSLGATPGAERPTSLCKSARKGLRFYVRRHNDWRHLMGVGGRRLEAGSSERDSCPYTLWRAKRWRTRSFAARQAYELYVERHTLHDFPVRAGSRAWLRAVQEAQRAFPGTEAWLLSCSASEGGWGRWVTNSQGSGVGGWLQYQPGTFSSFFHAAHSHVTGRGYRVPRSAASWYSPLGQALAGGWAIRNGMRHHWAGAGC